MRIGVSNLLWTRDLDETVAGPAEPARHRRDRHASRPATSTTSPPRSDGDVRAVRRFWHGRGIEIIGMQSLLHGTSGLNIFGDAGRTQANREHLRAVLRGSAPRSGRAQLVFGSWRNRDRGALDADAAMESAVGFFGEVAARGGAPRRLPDDRADQRTLRQQLPASNHDEAARLVERVGQPGLPADPRHRLHRPGAGEDVAAVVQRHGHLVSHVQLAESELAPLSAGNPLHAAGRPDVLTTSCPVV